MVNAEIKQAIITLMANRIGYAEIARQLSIPNSTVKSFVYRHKEMIDEVLTKDRNGIRICPQCSGIVPKMKYKPRRFCSDECRIRYWHEHRTELQYQAPARYYCQNCHKPFLDYVGKGRKYCSHPCYIAARFTGGYSDEQVTV